MTNLIIFVMFALIIGLCWAVYEMEMTIKSLKRLNKRLEAFLP
jgi:hypothetical protein